MPSEPRGYPEKLEIVPLSNAVKTAVSVPGSKSITNRALVLAAQCRNGGEPVCLTRALRSEDTEVMVESLRRLGFEVADDMPETILVSGAENSPLIANSNADLFVGNSGTTMRFLTAFVSAGKGRYRLDGVPRMRERPIEDLLSALRQLGVNARSEFGNGCPPIIVEANGLRSGTVKIKGSVSSQFVSAILMVAPLADGDVVLEVDGPLVSEPYVAMTAEMMRQFRMPVNEVGPGKYYVSPWDGFGPSEYLIEPDASAASYFFAAAAITGGTVTVSDLSRQSLQGDVRFVDVLQEMGCRVAECQSGITVHGRSLRGIEVDMNGISDTVMTLGAVACFAESPTTMRNVAHIRNKETDRISALATELRKVGAEVEEFADGLRITPGKLHGAEIETYLDHRMAMSMAMVGLKTPGVVIRNPGCVAKTYPGFWEDLERLRA
jgi:3-phosphoshikimate 1-carboxyvinyltransferase